MDKWDLIFLGIQICLAVQLAIVGLCNLVGGKSRNAFLGIYCLLVSQSPFILAFPNELKSSAATIVLFWAWKGFFYGPLLYLFISSLNQNRGRNHYIKHLIIPFVLYGMSLFKLLFIEGGTLAGQVLNNIKYYSHWSIILVYFYWGLQEFRIYLSDVLEDRSRARFSTFYVVVNVHLVSSIFPGLILVLSKSTTVLWIDMLSESFAVPFYTYFIGPFYIVLFLYLIFFGMTELTWVKKHFPKSNIYLQPKSSSEDMEMIKSIINQSIEGHHFYRKANVSIYDLIELTGLSQKAIRNHLVNEGHSTFHEFVNWLRIEEIKKKLTKKINSHYDFVSLASESGFQSKATFYRVFKQFTGKTPSSFASQNREAI